MHFLNQQTSVEKNNRSLCSVTQTLVRKSLFKSTRLPFLWGHQKARSSGRQTDTFMGMGMEMK